jgi:glutamate synthase (NADPH) small chain
MEEARRCLQCKKPRCVANCPVQIDIPGFIAAMAQGDFAQAVLVLSSKRTSCLRSVGVFARKKSSVKRLRPGEERRPDCHRPVGALPGRLGGRANPGQLPKLAAPSGKQVAVVGGGPAGLTVAADLVQHGHRVVFEALHKMGGVLSYGIPEFRLPKKIVDREVAFYASWGWRWLPIL